MFPLSHPTNKRLLALLLVAAASLGLAACDPPREPRPATKQGAPQAKSKLIDINRASEQELMALRGIGEARARAIVKGRPYARKDELVQQKIVPQSVYDEIKDQIIARQ